MLTYLVILARTENDAKIFQNMLIEFLKDRGLELSFEKTKILNLNTGEKFTFLAKDYYKKDGVIHSVPSKNSEEKFKIGLDNLLFDPKIKWTPKKIVTEVNYKINGYASYFRICEAKDTFRRLDSYVMANVLKLIKTIYPKLTIEQIKKKYYWKCADGRYIFALASNRDCKIVNFIDIPLIKAKRIDLKKNVFLDKEYFDNLNDKREIENVTGRYKKIWEIQEGKCAICGRIIKDYESRKIIYKRLSKDSTIRNMLYIHSMCEESEKIIIYGDFEENLTSKKTIDILVEINDIENGIKPKKKPSKFDKLKSYFHELNKNKVTLTFKNIEKIIDSKLCSSAYKYQSYFYNQSDERSIANCWISQGYRIEKFDMENQKITFCKENKKKSKVLLPKFLFKNDLPKDAILELEEFFKKIKTKYEL